VLSLLGHFPSTDQCYLIEKKSVIRYHIKRQEGETIIMKVQRRRQKRICEEMNREEDRKNETKPIANR
jgi:hypothetical protein